MAARQVLFLNCNFLPACRESEGRHRKPMISNVFQFCDTYFPFLNGRFYDQGSIDFDPDPDNLIDSSDQFVMVRTETKLEDIMMSRIIHGIVALGALLAAVAVFARLPVASPIFEIIVLGALAVLLVTVEWPRWHHARWPNKLGEL